MQKFLSLLLVALFLSVFPSCRQRSSEAVTVALSDKFTTLDTLTSPGSDAAAERIKTLMFNTLVRKDANFNYVGELASEIKTSDDGKVIIFTLRDGVKFHNGQDFTSADVKYTFDQLLASNGFKKGAFFDTVPDESAPKPAAGAPAAEAKTKQIPHIVALETPDPKTVIVTLARPALRTQLLSNLVAVPIIPTGTAPQQKDNPVGSGPFKFASFNAEQNVVELEANPQYWEGAPKISKLRVKTVTDAQSLQSELQAGSVDIAPLPTNLPPDTLKAMDGVNNLKVEQFEGSNIQYLVFNTQSAPLNNAKVRQAIGYGIDRQKIIADLLYNQAKLANSIIPTQSWAYAAGTEYKHDPAKAKQLLQEAGYKDEPIVFKYNNSSAAINQYAQVIQSSLNEVGLNVRIETLEVNTIRQQLGQGQFQMYTGQWIGGNQDPIFLRDLFGTGKIPQPGVPGSALNRSRYSNPEVDKLIDEAMNATDQNAAKAAYGKAWEIISSELPLLPLWYNANMVVSNKRIAGIKMNASGDWSFLKDISVGS